MRYNFDEVTERTNTDSLKYDFAVRNGKPKDILPLWIADMDFKSPPCIIETLEDKINHGIFGYSDTGFDYDEILQKWFFENFGWTTDAEWLVKTPGVVYSVCAAIRALTNEGDCVLIQQPVYYPFYDSVLLNKRTLAVNQLVYSDRKYSVDFDDFEEQIIKNNVKLFILCSPHNPVGRVWTKDELIRMGDICLKHGVTIIADEIHEDFIYPGYKHLVFSSLRPEFNEITVTCTSPTKTFNLAGLQIANIFIVNSDIRRRFKKEIAKTGYCELNIMGIVACKAAYSQGHEWLAELKAYLSDNLNFLDVFLQKNIPQIKLITPQGTYLAWLDCKNLELSDEKLDDLIVNKAKLWLDAGTMFGLGGNGFQRINIACPKTILEKFLTRLKCAVQKHFKC